MRWSRLIPILICLALQPLFSADPKPAPDEKKQAADRDFDVPMPLNMPVKGIKIPHRNEEGKLIMTIEAEVATKLDEQHVEMENMKVESFDEDGKKINIELPHSIFDLETRILTGDRHAYIHREDFEVTGDSVEFNTKTRHAVLRGKIRMVIQSSSLEQ
jgi:hypothetical protein